MSVAKCFNAWGGVSECKRRQRTENSHTQAQARLRDGTGRDGRGTGRVRNGPGELEYKVEGLVVCLLLHLSLHYSISSHHCNGIPRYILYTIMLSSCFRFRWLISMEIFPHGSLTLLKTRLSPMWTLQLGIQNDVTVIERCPTYTYTTLVFNLDVFTFAFNIFNFLVSFFLYKSHMSNDVCAQIEANLVHRNLKIIHN